jgi:hypothetical protein
MSKKKGNKVKKSKVKNIQFKDNNVSKRYPNGRTFFTDDIYLPDDKNKKTKSKSRNIVVVDSNRRDEFAVVSLTKKNEKWYPFKNGKTIYKAFKPFLEIEDNEGNAIKHNEKFKENPWVYDLDSSDVDYISSIVFEHSVQAPNNREKRDVLKSGNKKGKPKT